MRGHMAFRDAIDLSRVMLLDHMKGHAGCCLTVADPDAGLGMGAYSEGEAAPPPPARVLFLFEAHEDAGRTGDKRE